MKISARVEITLETAVPDADDGPYRANEYTAPLTDVMAALSVISSNYPVGPDAKVWFSGSHSLVIEWEESGE